MKAATEQQEDGTYERDVILNSLRNIFKKYHLSNVLHIVRQLIHFGPWRHVPIYFIRKCRPAIFRDPGSTESLLGRNIEEATVAARLRQESVAMMGVLPADFITRLRAVTDYLPPNEYQLVHQANLEFLQLTEDPGIKKVLRAYLRCEPELLEASLFVSGPEQNGRLQDQHCFHFDYAGWESLNVFVYLSDVTENSSHHIVVKGSHKNIRARDIIRGSITAIEGERRFGAAVQPITGPAGTLFFENTEAYHRRHPGNERRVMLNLLYASHRSLLSHGRANRKQLQLRDREFARVKQASLKQR